MDTKKLRKRAGVSFEYLPEERIALEGNVLASGNPREDRAAEDAIRARLDQGDEWAWFAARAVAEYAGVTGRSGWLGACSYRDEREWLEGDYADDLISEAIQDLADQLAVMHTALRAVEE